jgi:hypothetical protein
MAKAQITKYKREFITCKWWPAMSFGGIPPFAQWSSSKSVISSPKISNPFHIKQLGFYNFSSGFAKIGARCVKSEPDFSLKVKLMSHAPSNRSPIIKNRSPIFYVAAASHQVMKSGYDALKSEYDFRLPSSMNSALCSLYLVPTTPELHWNYNKKCSKSKVWPSVITTPNLHHYLSSRNKL